MVQVTGTVHDVSGNPDRVEQIIVRAVEPRMHDTTYITEEAAQFPVVDGVLDFEVLPGPCVVAFLRYHGATTYEKLLVPDKTSATLAECIEAAGLATDGTRSALERLALEVQAELGQVPALVSDALAQDSTIIDAVKQINQAIRVDTSVGTRVFAGGTMIYGYTGIRSVPDMVTGLDFTQSDLHNAWMVREGNRVALWGTGYTVGESHLTDTLPNGFKPPLGHYAANTGSGTASGVVYPVGHHHSWRRLTFSGGVPPEGLKLSIQASWITLDSWPSSLPGDPT